MDLLLLVSLITLLPLEIVNGDYVADADTLSCQGFAADRVIRDIISSGHATAEPCPCIEQIIAIDETFEKIDNCYKQWFFMDGVKQMCCYSENGQLVIDSPGAGYLLLESNEGYIERAHDMCCGNGSDVFKTSCESFYQINKPDDCSTYVPPVVSISSGDPVIQTIDGGKFDFNGHGEYVFLTDGKNFEIQARTDYVVTGNKDSTYFSAFALLDKASHEQVELHYDRKTEDIRFFRNGTRISNCNASSMLGHGKPYPCELPQRQNCFVLAGGGKITILNCGFKSYIKQLVFGTDNFLSIQIIRDPKANITNITGLAGHREDGFYIMRNNTKVSENASALSFFQFGESWSLRNESESVFMYIQTGGNFTIYNKHHSRPEFLEDKLGNLTALFKTFTAENISLFNKTCRNYWNNEPNNQCLLAIARTRDYNLGLDVMQEANATRYKWEIIHNEAPNVSSDFPKNITVNINSTFTINLTEYVTDNNTCPEKLVFDVVTNLTKEEYSIDSGIFTWNVGTGLREIDTGIKFIVYDKFNASSVFSFSINYCGCSEVSFCSFPKSMDHPSDTVVKASCVCPAYASGKYCEVVKDVCPKYNCYNNVCNVMVYKSKASWPCGPCPKGRDNSMSGYNQTCKDIDECSVDYSEADKCEQNCTNTDGSFRCSCFSGYDLNSDRRSCDDIDECNKGLTLCHGKNEACVNTPGNYSCICVAGYDRSGGVCEKLNGPQFVGNIVFVIDKEPSAGENKTIDSPKNRLEMQIKLKEMFKLYKNFESVEVFRLLYIEKKRTKRQDSQKQYLLQVNYIVHCKNKTDYTSMSEELKGSVEKYKANISNDKPVVLGEVTINIHSAVAKVNNSTEGGRCTVQGKTDCAKDSTDCKDYDDGTFNCTCKKGFKPSFANVEYKYCNDIDECKEFTANNTIKERCIYGVCRNSIGSWYCTCNPDKLWKNIGNYSYPVYRCQGNYSYIGNISVADHDPSKKTNIVEFIQNQLKTFYEDPNNENNSYAVPMSSLFVNARVLSLFKNISHSSFRQYNVTFLLRIGEIVESGRLFNVLKNVLSQGDYRTLKSSLVFENNSYAIFNDIDECEIEGKCNNEKCVNSIGNWSCKCNNSYSIPVSTDKYNFSCKDVSVCEFTNMDFKCKTGNRTCRSDTEKWECTCEKGFSPVYKDINSFECEDANECAETGDTCSGHGTCKNNIDGKGYSCNCENGYKENSTNPHNVTCEDIDECKGKTTCSGHGSCVNNQGGFECKCYDGFVLNYSNETCIDINECTNKSYYCGGVCNNTLGSWTCDCEEGYSKESNNETKVSITCEDINECDKGAKCDEGVCINLDGSWTCDCPDGKQPERLNSTKAVCRGGYQYIMSTGISVPVSSGVKESEISLYMKAQIETIYAAKFQHQHVRVEIISVISVGSGKRRKRQASENYEINFVLHFNQSIPHENISKAWKDYIQHNCSQNRCPPPKNVGELPVVIENKIDITKDQSAALCSLDKFNLCNPDTSTCNFVNGSANCDCKKGYNVTQSNLTCEVSKDVCNLRPCENSATCRMTQGNKDFECVCRDGWTGKYCENAHISKTDETTILIATASSLSAVVIILTLTVMIVCRSRSKKIKEAEKMSIKHMDGSLFRNRYIDDDDDGDGSFYSRRLSNSSLPYGHQNRVSGIGNQKDLSPNQYQLPRINLYSSMPNLADNGINFNRFDDQIHSGDKIRRIGSYNQDLNRSYDIDLRASRNSWNGRRSPPPDYRRPRSPKPDYLGSKLQGFSDSGVRNDNNSKRNEYSDQENRELHYLYQQRQSTNF